MISNISELDSTSLYCLLKFTVKSENIELRIQMISTLEQVSKVFRSQAGYLWRNFARELSIPVGENERSKIEIQRCVEQIRKNYPKELLEEIGVCRLIRVPVLDLHYISNFIPRLCGGDQPLRIDSKMLTAPLMRGRDFANRPFLSVLCLNEHSKKYSITIHRSTELSVEWTFAQENGIYGKIEFTDKNAMYVKFMKLLSDEMISLEAPRERNFLKISK